jgi:CheY-like chemotaxis protein
MVNVLFVDDDESVQRASKRFFSVTGHNFHLAKNGLEALDVLRVNEGIDIIFTDFNMPGMNGFGLCHAIRTDPQYQRYANTPIIGVGEFPEDKRNYLTEDLQKQYDNDDLLRCIAKYCR